MLLTTNILPLYDNLDTATFAETLRGLTWDADEGELGCYSAWDLHHYVQEFSEDEREDFWREVATNATDEGIVEYVSMGEGGRVQTLDGHFDYAYFWDGDGTVVYRVFDNTGALIISVRNSDCKKTDRWVKNSDPGY